MTANAGDQVNQLHAEIARLKEEHGQKVVVMETTHATEKSSMEADFEAKLAALKADYERQLQELGLTKDN